MENRTKYFLWLLAFFSLASIILYALLLTGEQALYAEEEARVIKQSPFASLELEAKSIVVWDVVNNTAIYEKSADMPLPLASLTKVMTALVAREAVVGDKIIKITVRDLEPDGDSGLSPGDEWSFKDLLDFTLLTSSNDGARALASVAVSDKKFVEEMNKRAQTLGLSSSKYFNEHGLDQGELNGGAYGSARDMAKLFAYIIKNNNGLLEATKYSELSFESGDKHYAAENTNDFVNQIPNILASKTGYTELAGGNLVIAFDPGLNRPIIVSVLGSSQEGRFSDTLKLIAATMQYLQQ